MGIDFRPETMGVASPLIAYSRTVLGGNLRSDVSVSEAPQTKIVFVLEGALLLQGCCREIVTESKTDCIRQRES